MGDKKKQNFIKIAVREIPPDVTHGYWKYENNTLVKEIDDTWFFPTKVDDVFFRLDRDVMMRTAHWNLMGFARKKSCTYRTIDNATLKSPRYVLETEQSLDHLSLTDYRKFDSKSESFNSYKEAMKTYIVVLDEFVNKNKNIEDIAKKANLSKITY